MYKPFSVMDKVWRSVVVSHPKVNIIQVKAVPKYHLQNLTQVFPCIGIHCLSLYIDVNFEENYVSVPTT